MNSKGFRSNLAKEIKKIAPKMIIGTTGKLSDVKILNKMLDKKDFDLAFIGRPFLKNPYWILDEDKKNFNKLIPSQYLRGYK